MVNKICIIIAIVFSLAAIISSLFGPVPQPAGDFVEYYGMTESLINHASLALSNQDKTNIEAIVGQQMFTDPQYYITGRDGQRYPVHFPLYSLLALPVRMFLELTQNNILRLFAVANSLIMAITLIIGLRNIKRQPAQFVFIACLILSPLASFISWPGPDLLQVCLLTIASIYYFRNRPLLSAIVAAIASWQNSALGLIPVGFLGYWLATILKNKPYPKKNIAYGVITVLILLAIPFGYNLLHFGTLSPWQILNDQATVKAGFGWQNAGIKKTFELFFDPNIGLFWYAPLMVAAGIFFAAKNRRYRQVAYIAGLFLLTTVLYQFNPSWSNGTAGFGPGRYSLFLIGLLVVFVSLLFIRWHSAINFVLAYAIIQLGILSYNGLLTPDFATTHYHSYAAQFILDRWPRIYNPTPQIFVDRTNHDDRKIHRPAVYIIDGICRKAYIPGQDTDAVAENCPNQTISSVSPAGNPDQGFYVDFKQ